MRLSSKRSVAKGFYQCFNICQQEGVLQESDLFHWTSWEMFSSVFCFFFVKFSVREHGIPRALDINSNGGIKRVCGILPLNH